MDLNAIGKRLTALRKNLGQSRAYVARKIGVSYSAMVTYEKSIHIPGDRVKIALANYYGVTVEELFFTDDDHESYSHE